MERQKLQTTRLNATRTPNFSNQEECTLVRLVKNYRDVIECKKTDSEANLQKKATWKQIASIFNASGAGTYRDENTLQRKYQNLKKSTKKKFAEEKRAITATGGGKPPNVEISQIENDIKEMLGYQIVGRESAFDDDQINEGIYYLTIIFNSICENR